MSKMLCGLTFLGGLIDRGGPSPKQGEPLVWPKGKELMFVYRLPLLAVSFVTSLSHPSLILKSSFSGSPAWAEDQ